MAKSERDEELESMSSEKLAELTLSELQRIRNKRWAAENEELLQEAEDELSRRNPMKDWQCMRCRKSRYHTKKGMVTSSTTRLHIVVCNYCGKSEFFNVLHDQQWP